ncbi:hypothetical protein WJ54_12315 [Burkholderia ubonensis]|nr:hypothetical protein WJ54_12315 [Burkholderia ubonensis]
MFICIHLPSPRLLLPFLSDTLMYFSKLARDSHLFQSVRIISSEVRFLTVLSDLDRVMAD